MKILCDRRRLLETVGVVSSAVPGKSSMPILMQLRMTASEEDGLVLRATDMEVAVSSRIEEVKVERPGDALVPAREFAAVLRGLTEPTVALEVEEGRCSIEGPSGSLTIVGGDPSQYPEGFVPPEGPAVRVARGAVADLVRRTAFAASREATRYALNGIFCEVKEERLRMVGTDGRRLALAHRSVLRDGEGAAGSWDGEDLEGVIVPVKGLQAVAQALALLEDFPEAAVGQDVASEEGASGEASRGGGQGAVQSAPSVEVRLSRQMAAFSAGPTEVFARPLDGEFPDFENVIPREADTVVEFERDRFESLVRMASIFSDSEVRGVRVKISGTGLEVSAEAASVGSATLRMDADVKGEGGEAVYNSDFLLEMVKATDAPTIRFEFTDSASPGKFLPEEEFLYVVMPITM